MQPDKESEPVPIDAASSEFTRGLYEKNVLVKYLDRHHPTLFRLIWEIYLAGLHIHNRVKTQALPLQPVTPILQVRDWAHERPLEHDNTGQHILFFSFTGWSTHVLLDGLLGKALALRGARVSYFTCGGILPLCYIHNASSDVPPMPCGRCRAYADSCLRAFGFRAKTMADLLSAGEQSRLVAQVNALERAQLLDFDWDGLPIGEFSSVSSRWFMLTNQMDSTEEMMTNLRKYILLGLLVHEVTRKLIAYDKPDKIVLVNGLQVAEQVVRAMAAREGIPCICTERGYRANTFFATHGDPCAIYPLDHLWEHYRSQPLSSVQFDQLNDYVTSRRHGRHKQMDVLSTNDQIDNTSFRSAVGLQPGRPLVAAFTNVCGDTALIDRDLAYPDIIDWIDHLVSIFTTRPDIDLVFRVHPAETRIRRYSPRIMFGRYIVERYPNLPPNIKVIPSESTLSSYTLTDLSDLVMVYSSTLGLETTLMNKPTTVAAQVHYREKGFTCDVESPDNLVEWVDRWATGQMPLLNIEMAQRYAYLFFFRAMIPLDEILEETSFGRMRLKITGPDELRVGHSAAIDTLCNGILNDQPFLNPYVER